jgi:peptide/nickel transport system permease protein
MWWPWYACLAYNLTRAEKQEGCVVAADCRRSLRILFAKSCRTACPDPHKMTVDAAFVILIASSMSSRSGAALLPDLGSMVADGVKYMPDAWWLTFSRATLSR